MYDITASIVAYKNDFALLTRVMKSFLDTRLNVKLYLVDNSPTDAIKKLCVDERVEYIFNGANTGYGAAHNVAINRVLEGSKYHLVLNPDVYFSRGTAEKIFEFMNSNVDVGLVMPKILYPDGTVQHLCKLLPAPFDLIFRRFVPFRKIIERRNDVYELRLSGYDRLMDVPYLSGCFMFIRTSAFKKAGCFDERFFMYLEDTDLSRRINQHCRTVYYPEAAVYHAYQKGSYKNKRLLYYHVSSAIKYFNKWGWFFDKQRNEINRKTLDRCRTTVLEKTYHVYATK